MSPVVDAVTVKIPAPITTATPKTTRSHQVRSLRNLVSGSSVSAIDCSTDFVRHRLAMQPPFPNAGSHWSDTVLGTPRMPDSKANARDHALVIGEHRGLCAARVLSDTYARVTVYERDELPATPAHRATVPQDRHLHMLMARGAIEFEGLFPGLLDDMVAAGVPKLENRPDCIHLGPRATSWAQGKPCATNSPPMCPAGRTWNGSCASGFTTSTTSPSCGARWPNRATTPRERG